MKKRVFFVLAILFFIYFPIIKDAKLNPSKFKSFEKELHSNNGPTIIPFIVGAAYGFDELDPHWTWDRIAWDTIDQVCEGLFKYDLSHPSNEIIPSLASADGIWSGDGLEFWVPLREGITFHDGYKFNASAVKWSFDRLAYLMNISGTLPNTVYYKLPTILHSLYEWPDGTPIINLTEVFNEYAVRFVLNRPYGPFKALLCFSGSYILSPLSTPATDYINPNTDDLVGTGPFVFDGIIPNEEVNLSAYEYYWRGKANIDQIIFKYYHGYYYDELNKALLNGTIHFIEDVLRFFIEPLKAANNLTVLDSGKTSTTIQYLGMNNKRINQTWRQAISYAFNYSDLIESQYLMDNQATRLKSPIPEGVLFANSTLNYPIFDIKKAREYVKSMFPAETVGWDTTYPGTSESSWLGATFSTFNYTYNLGNLVREGVYDILYECLDLIGVTILDSGLVWEDFKDRVYNYRQNSAGWDALELYWLGWWPDFNDPSSIINNLMSNISIGNSAQINDPYLESLMSQGLFETDDDIRRTIYNNIQKYIVEDLMPLGWGYVENLYTAYNNNLTGFQQNGFSILDFYSCTWDPYNYTIEINSPADISFVKGALGNNIIWTLSAEHFSNPTYNLTVNGLLNRTDSWQSGAPIIVYLDHLSPGTYTYQITAKNGDETVQDVVIVSVDTHELTINHPEDITFTEGSIGITITWTIITNLEVNPTYNLYINDVFSDSDSWHSGIPVVVNLNNLTVGSYEYHIEASNGVELIEDTVIIKVNAKTQEDGTITLLIIIGGAIGAGIAVIITILLIRKRRK